MEHRPKLDEVDAKILKILLKTPFASFEEVAALCGMTANGIRIRIQRLIREGVILKWINQVNPCFFGYNCIVILGFVTYLDREKEVAEFLKGIPEIVGKELFLPDVGSLVGIYNLQCLALLKNTDELADLMGRLRKCRYIRSIEHSIWVDITRLDYPENLEIPRRGVG